MRWFQAHFILFVHIRFGRIFTLPLHSIFGTEIEESNKNHWMITEFIGRSINSIDKDELRE